MTSKQAAPFYVTGGTLSRMAVSYVARQADETLRASLRKGQLCYVLTPRQMGKSSLMVRTADHLRLAGVRVALLDLSALGQNLTVAQWYEGMLRCIAAPLHLEEALDDFLLLHSALPPLECWLRVLRELILRGVEGSLVIFIDEIDMVRSLPFPTDEFFAGIRACYNQRALDPAFARLTFCLLGVASPSGLILNVDITPFNIGKRIELHDFTLTEASILAKGMDERGRNGSALLARVLYWTGGHPYLTQMLCAEVASEPSARRDQDVDRLCTELFLTRTAQDADDNLAIVRSRLLRSEGDLTALLELYGRVRAGKRVDDEETNSLCSALKLSGIARVEGGRLRVRNRIYGQVFDRAWITTNLPGAEVRRQRAAYQRGVRRTLALAGVVLAILTGLTEVALKQADRANHNAMTASRNQKSADNNARKWLLAVKAEQRVALVAVKNAEEADREKQRANKQKVFADDRLRQANAARAIAMQATLQAKYSIARANAQTAEAAKQRDLAEHEVYIGTMNLIRASYERNDFDQIAVMLARNRLSRFRGFEWGYWNRLCHLALQTLKAPGGREIAGVDRVVCSADGKWIVTGSRDTTARVWNAGTCALIRTLKAHGEIVLAVAFSPDGKRIVTGGKDDTARMWDVASGQETLTFEGHRGGIASVAFSPDGKSLVTGSLDGTARVWRTDWIQ